MGNVFFFKHPEMLDHRTSTVRTPNYLQLLMPTTSLYNKDIGNYSSRSDDEVVYLDYPFRTVHYAEWQVTLTKSNQMCYETNEVQTGCLTLKLTSSYSLLHFHKLFRFSLHM